MIMCLLIRLLLIFSSGSNGRRLSSKACIEVNDVRFDAIFQYLGQLSVTLLNIEEVLVNQSTLRRDFVNYRRTFDIVATKSNDFNVQASHQTKVRLLQQLHIQIEKEIIDGKIFRHFTDTILSASTQAPSGTATFCDHLSIYIKNGIQFYESENNPLKDDKKWLAINALMSIYFRISDKDERRLYKAASDAQKRVNILYVHLRGNCTICMDKFLSKHLPKSKLDRKSIEQLILSRENMIKISLSEKVSQISTRVNVWMLEFDECVKDTEEATSDLIDCLQRQAKVINEGLELAHQSTCLAKNHIHQHLISSKAMTKSNLIALCKLVSILKGIELLFARRKSELITILSRSTQYYSYHILDSLTATKKRLIAEVKKYSEKKLDVLSAIILASNCIHGPILTSERQILASLCFSISNLSMSEAEITKVFAGFKKIKTCAMVFRRLEDWTRCEFMFFTRSLFGIYYNHCATHELDSLFEFKYFFRSFTEFFPVIDNAFRYDETSKRTMMKNLQDEIMQQVKTEYIGKLCANLETKLRLQVHSELQLDDQNPFRKGGIDFLPLMAAEPFRLFDQTISIREEVENYLNQLAYNMSTIALHDWRTYESMLGLARHVYGMEFLLSQLPTQTLEQGLDVLEITRNIHIFVSRYLYNLGNQMFIEKSSENKHLNVLLIRHIANSIKTHGFGIINTAVNFTYQFLKRKLSSFSQFLFEDPIKSRLVKDLKHFRETKDGKFSYERADYLVKGVRKMGLTPEGYSFLDRFRILITEIGNALGFVRMLRSGALHCSSNAIAFVPDLDELGTVSFKNMVIEDGLGAECLHSAENLDLVLTTLNRNFSEATDYFSLLVQVFQSNLRNNTDSNHLRNFYIILPALTINYVENSILNKEKIVRKNKTDASFTDDGFPMGVAYILKLLDQHMDFDSLQWFSSVNDNINKEREAASGSRNSNATTFGPDKSQTKALTEKRLCVRQKEFDLLRYSLTSCRILFKATHESHD